MKCSMKETPQIYFTSVELEKLHMLQLLIADNQPVVIYGETGEYYPVPAHLNLNVLFYRSRKNPTA